jgi:hypothetical protein
MLGEKNGGKKGVWMGKKMACCVLGGRNKREERKPKQNKRKSWPAARGWVGRKKRERERKKKKKKGLLLRTWLGGKKINKGLLRTSWLGGRKKREREREKKKKKVCCARGWVGERKGRDGKKIK